MGCCGGSDVIRCGTTYRLDLEYRERLDDGTTGDLLPMLPKARAVIRTAPDAPALLSLSSASGDITLNDPEDGRGELVIASDSTLSVDEPTDAFLYIEFFDDGVSPEEVEPFPPQAVTIEPDWTA